MSTLSVSTSRLPLALAGLALLLTAGCSGGDTDSVEQTGTSATPTLASTGSCTPAGTGTTDLTTKPVVVVPKTPAPTETTSVDIVCGTGAEAKEGTQVEVKYVGVLYADGSEFDASWKGGADNTFPFTVGSGVVAGFSKGVTGMKVGGRRAVTIPAVDGYGESGSGPIPGGATLIFVIDLVKAT